MVHNRSKSFALGLIVLGALLAVVGLIGFLTARGDEGAPTSGAVAATSVPTASSDATATPDIADASAARVPTASATAPVRQVTPTVDAPNATEEPSPTTHAIMSREQLDEFVARFVAAIADGDVDFLVSRLHPMIIATFDEPTCRATVTDQILLFENFTVGEPLTGPNAETYTLADGTTAVAEVYSAPISFDFQARSFDNAGTWGLVDGEVHWFLACR